MWYLAILIQKCSSWKEMSSSLLLCTSFMFSVCLIALWILANARDTCRSLLPCGSLWPLGILWSLVDRGKDGVESLLFVQYLMMDIKLFIKTFSSLVSSNTFLSVTFDWGMAVSTNRCDEVQILLNFWFLLNSHQIYTTKTTEMPESNYVFKWIENPGGSYISPGMMVTPASF